MLVFRFFVLLFLFLSGTVQSWAVSEKTRGIGIYPGLPSENFSPSFVVDKTYRNLALHRTVRHSSAYDYNLTAQLLTDGIVESEEPVRLWVGANGKLLPKREREWAIDGGEYTRNTILGADATLEYRWTGMIILADSVEIVGQMAYRGATSRLRYQFAVETLDVDDVWQTLGHIQGDTLPGFPMRWTLPSDPNKQTDDDGLPARRFHVGFHLDGTAGHGTLRLHLQQSSAVYWTITQLNFYYRGKRLTRLLPSSQFSSAWMSLDGSPQWISVDLGTVCSFDTVRLHWIHRAGKGQIETSSDGKQWRLLAELPEGQEKHCSLACKGRGRYVRIRMSQPDASGHYVLSEVEVMGRGGLVPQPHAACVPQARKLSLNGGDWRLMREQEVFPSGKEISSSQFDDKDWIAATVPATVLMSYVNIGALPDPNRADNLFQISESYFNAPFWYRKEFTLPESFRSRHVFLNLDGINWKADVYLNGEKIHRLEGAFLRGRMDVTPYLREGINVLAVRIEPCAHPGAVKEKNEQNTDYNGGILGADNPTFHATVGWDWISTIRGRNMGLWNDVYLTTTSGAVSVHDPYVRTRLHLPDTLASLSPQVLLRNAADHSVQGVLKGWVGNIRFEKHVVLDARSEKQIIFSPDEYAPLCRQRMRLWWPNGLGSPYLYDAGFSFEENGQISDSLHFQVGIRQFEYADVSKSLKIYVNGVRFIPLGGNWGFSENNLCYRGREYDAAVRYHRDMNFNTIRNWVGQTGDEEFYEACDRNGIVVWQDFWLANPSDGPDPYDERMFQTNAHDYVMRIRRHPCLGIYCGRNEGYPPKSLDAFLQQQVAQYHPDLCYISSSADEGVSGHGPYHALHPWEYFTRQTGKLHTERGMPCVMNAESLQRTFSSEALWPQQLQWGQHDYVMAGAQRGSEFNKLIEEAFGPSHSAEEFAARAQWVNYEGYRAMFESDGKYRMGLLLWMTHPCWPSMTWQTYDYYFEPTAAYFGSKKACEPFHVQYNSATRKVEVVNRSREGKKVMVVAEIYDFTGRLQNRQTESVVLATDETKECLSVVPPATEKSACLLRLRAEAEEGPLSTNEYVLRPEGKESSLLPVLPATTLKASFRRLSSSSIEVRITNRGKTTASFVRINLKDKDGEQILPVIYSDNYFHLLPNETRKVMVSWHRRDARHSSPKIEVSALLNKKK